MSTNRLKALWGPRPALIADDLTGACDAGVQFAQRGIPATVWLEPERIPAEPEGLVVLSTDSRGETPEAAAAKVREACRWASGVVFKKIDSTLRGNVGSEIAAVLQARRLRRAIVSPAFPAMGRIVAGGWLRGGGVEIHIPSLLREQGLEEGVAIGDACTEDDLRAVAQAALRENPPPLLAGSAGLAAAVAEILAEDLDQEHRHPAPAGGKVLAVIGSDHPVTLRQVEALRTARPAVAILPLDWSAKQEEHLSEFLGMLEERPPGGLMLSGGDTARLVCRLLEARAVRLVREIAPGVPWGRLVGGRMDGLPVVTKAGGFGKEDALVAAADFLSGPAHEQR